MNARVIAIVAAGILTTSVAHSTNIARAEESTVPCVNTEANMDIDGCEDVSPWAMDDYGIPWDGNDNPPEW